MEYQCFWRGLEYLTVNCENSNLKNIIKVCNIENKIIILSSDRTVYCAPCDNTNVLNFRKVPDIIAIDIACNSRHVFFVDNLGQVFKCEGSSWDTRQELIIKEDAKNCSHGHKTPSRKVKIKSIAAGEFGVLFISNCGRMWASGFMPQLSIDSVDPKKVSFFDGRSIYRASIGNSFGIVITRKSICDDETDTDNDEDVFISTCSECLSNTRVSTPASQLSLGDNCPLGVLMSKSSDETSSTSAPHTHNDRPGEAPTLTEDTSSSTEDSELTKIHFDENKKTDFASKKSKEDKETIIEEESDETSTMKSSVTDVNDDDKRNLIFINTEAAKQFLTKQLSWVSAGEDYLVECTEKPTRILKENVSNLTNLVVESVKTVGDKVATLSRHMSGSSETNDAVEAYEGLVNDESNPMMYTLTSSYKLDDFQLSSSTVSDKDNLRTNEIEDKVKALIKNGQSLLNSEVWVWGDINHGQLGTGDTIKRNQPILVSRLTNLGVHQISCGKSHCAALTLDGRVYCWGHNIWHQVNTDSVEDKSSPQLFTGNSNTDRVRNIACGDNHTSVFTLEGNLFFSGKHKSGFTETVQNLKEHVSISEKEEKNNDAFCKHNMRNGRAKKYRDFYSGLSEDLNFNCRILSTGMFTYFYAYPHHIHETPALQDLAIEQQFLAEMHIIHQSLIKPLLKKTASISPDSNVYENLCSAYTNIMYFTAVNVLSFWKYTEGHKKAIDVALIENSDEHISLYQKYLDALCNVICINGFNQIALHVELPASLQKLFNDKLPSSKLKTGKISDEIISCALLHPLSRLNTYKCILQSLIRYNWTIAVPEIKTYFQQRMLDVLNKWNAFNDEQEKKKRDADVTKLFWESSGKTIESFRSPSRRLLRESRSHPLSLRHAGRYSSHWFILLTDVMIHLCGSTQNIHPLTALWVEPVVDSDALQNAILLTTPEEVLTVIAPTSQDKNEWLQALQLAVKNSLKKKHAIQPPMVRTASYSYTSKNQLYKDAKYSGRWLNGKLHGSGKLTWSDGRTYIGQFHHNQIHGHGRMEIPNIGVYDGQWKNNLQNGFGVTKYYSGDIYQGFYKDGLSHGHGVKNQGDFTTSTATIYMGDWVQGVRQGYGVMDDIGKGEKYLGSWNDNKKHGCGLIVTLDGIYYEGVFTNDILTGHGVMVFEDGTHYEGEFRSAGVFSGKGTLTFSSGDCIEGVLNGAWTEGVKISSGTLQMNVSNPALPPNSKPKSFGKLCVAPSNKWNGLFRQFFQQLGVSEGNLVNVVTSNNQKIWQNVAVILSTAQTNGTTNSQPPISMQMCKGGDNKTCSEQLDVIPEFGQDSLTIESYLKIKQYLVKACESSVHPIGQLVAGCAAAFSTSYGGVRVHPLLLSHAVDELGCLSFRLYSAIRLLFPALPLPEDHYILHENADNSDDDLDGERVSLSGIVQPLLLPRVHPSLHVLYALHHQREDVAYWKRLHKWNRQSDITLMAFLGIDQKFWVGYASRAATGNPPFSPVKDQLFSEAVDTLQQIKTTFSPMEKLLVIRSTFEQMTLAVQKELGPTYLWTMDELFPVFHFVVVRARILQLGSEIHFIEDFLEPSMQSGELGIMFTTLKACYFQILQEKVTLCE